MSRRRTVWLLLLWLCSIVGGLGLSARPAQAAEPQVVDDFSALPTGTDPNGVPVGFFTAQDGNTTVSFQATSTPPEPVPGIPTPNTVLKGDFTVSSYGVVIHNFQNAAANTWVSQDWSAYGGIGLWVYGQNSGTDLFIDLIDNRNPGSTRDDAERYSVAFKDNFSGWNYLEFPFDTFARKDIGNGAPNDGLTLTEVYGWAFGVLATTGTRTYYLDNLTLYGTAPVRPLTVRFTSNSFAAGEGQLARVTVKLSKASTEPVTVSYKTAESSATPQRDFTPTSGTLTFAPGVLQQTFTVATLDDSKYEGDEGVLLQLSNPSGAELGLPNTARVAIVDNDAYDPTLIDDFETQPTSWDTGKQAILYSNEIAPNSRLALPGQTGYEHVLTALHSSFGRSPAVLERSFPAGQDWSAGNAVSFWFFGQNSGKKYGVRLLDNAATDPGPSGWKLAWSDEFNAPRGLPPNPLNWTHEIGDGTLNGNAGWGNSELEYYTKSTQNAATDGRGNLQITVRKTDAATAPACYYGPCQFTSARLLSAHKQEFAYGRVEARIRVPRGAGLWPAFWMLGTDIDRVNWPQSGEIDIMEVVGRLPKRTFGTIHGPGYSGGQSFGGTYDLSEDVANNFHTFAVEWQPNKIIWYIDNIKYHEATPANVAPNEWVFNHPFFLLLNVAIGGNFGGPVGSDATFPQSMLVDYVRVYQAADTAERFEAPFTDNFRGWQKVTVPFSAFTRSKQQPKAAPNDGLTLTSVHGYGFTLPAGSSALAMFDQVYLKGTCTDSTTVTSTADSGTGSLRAAIAGTCVNGTISFAPALANQTIGLSSGELTIDHNVSIDGSAAPGLTISGGGTVRALVVNAKTNATIRNLTIANGYGFELAGGILNNGTLTLDRVVVANNRVATSGQDYWKGGAGIYNGDGSILNLRDSTVRDNTTEGADGGGVYGFFRTQLTIVNSTISGNSSSNVGGGMRTLGDATITNSTISGNRSTGWHGGGIFHTDGTMQLLNVTIANNTTPDGTAGGVFVGTFGDGSPTLGTTNTIIAGNSGAQCIVARYGAGAVTVTSGGHNLLGDNTCELNGPGDQIGANAQLGPLANNGGPTQTQALLAGSAAINTADSARCPATDQRGVRRPQGAGCDIGAYEAGG